MAALMYGAGLRLMECVRLRVKDVDFDRCEIRPGAAWKETNLARLQRSLRKEKGKRPVFHWGDSEWVHLIHGYHSI